MNDIAVLISPYLILGHCLEDHSCRKPLAALEVDDTGVWKVSRYREKKHYYIIKLITECPDHTADSSHHRSHIFTFKPAIFPETRKGNKLQKHSHIITF